jgi:hypothetical protein
MQGDKLETTDQRYASQQIRQPPTESRFRQNNVIELYIKQSSHIQQRNLQHSKEIFTPARQSPWCHLSGTGGECRKQGHHTSTSVPLPLQQTDRAKKMHLTNSSYIWMSDWILQVRKGLINRWHTKTALDNRCFVILLIKHCLKIFICVAAVLLIKTWWINQTTQYLISIWWTGPLIKIWSNRCFPNKIKCISPTHKINTWNRPRNEGFIPSLWQNHLDEDMQLWQQAWVVV